MRIFFDTEFIEDGRTIDLLSIGAVREDGERFYAEPAETDRSRASEWVAKNVLPNLVGPVMARDQIASSFTSWCGPEPEFWAWYADYDWVALCQLYGTMMDLPQGWPMYCRDFKQTSDEQNLKIVQDETSIHNALYDAQWLAITFQERWGESRRLLDTVKPLSDVGKPLMPKIPTGVVAVCKECGALVQKPKRHKRWHKYRLAIPGPPGPMGPAGMQGERGPEGPKGHMLPPNGPAATWTEIRPLDTPPVPRPA